MILTEHGLQFLYEPSGNGWRCVQLPTLWMLRDGRYEVSGRRFDDLAEAARAAGWTDDRAVD